MDKINATAECGASLVTGADASEGMDAHGVYHIQCIGPDGVEKWSDVSYNVVTYQGKNFLLDTAFAGSAYTAVWYMSLITAGTATTASTYASPTVTEIGTGIIASNTRPTVSWNASASGSKAATTTTFSITGSAVVTGNMIVTGASGANTVGNTSATNGILFSAASFSGGQKSVSSGDSLSITYNISV